MPKKIARENIYVLLEDVQAWMRQVMDGSLDRTQMREAKLLLARVQKRNTPYLEDGE